jgi:hypothetical protein
MAEDPQDESDDARLERYRGMAAEARRIADRARESGGSEEERLAQLWTALADELEELIRSERGRA